MIRSFEIYNMFGKWYKYDWKLFRCEPDWTVIEQIIARMSYKQIRVYFILPRVIKREIYFLIAVKNIF